MLHLSIAARPQGLNALVVVILLLALVHVSSASPHVNYVRQANVTTGGNPSRNKTIYTPLFERPSNSTPRFVNVTKQDARPLLVVPLTPALNKRQSTSQEEGTCGPGVPCTNGACCSNTGICGYSPDFCGAGNCISNCDAKAQCGQYAIVGKEKCPLNVCCSQFGFCGTTVDFCSKDKDCDESGGTCGDVPAPSCDRNKPGAKSIGYYESWASTRSCDKVEPEDLDLTGFTHLNFAFAFFHPTTFQMTDMDANAGRLYNRFTELKASKPSLKTWISVGGWSFNDETNIPNTRMAFSDMASTAENRAKFISSLVQFMSTYGFDGMDLDWEYPGADDRGGRPEDTANFVLLCKEIKAAFGGYYGFSITLPVSYWYLRHFDIAGMEPYVDWFNVMTYDIHGVWDSENRFTGPYVRPHTNLTEIDDGLSLLWRAGVSAGNVVLGLGWYGRSFKLASSSCTKPGCLFLEGAAPGECSKASGILTNAEIHRIIDDKGLTPSFDTEAAVNWITWDSDQWVSYDDERTFALKIKYAEDKCLGGTMIWAIDQGSSDGSTNDEYSGLDSLESSLKNKGLSLDASFPLSNGLKLKGVVKDASKRATAEDTCYTSFCGEPCVPGYTSVSTMNGQVGGLGEATACQEDNVQSLCCPSGTFTGRCEWYGWRGQGLSCSGSCAQGDDMIAKNTNHIYDYPEQNFFEDQTCNGGFQAYCCRGFRPGPNIDDIQLLEPEHFDPMSLDKRSLASCTTYAVIAGGILTFTPFISLALAGAVLVEGLCLTTEAAASSKAAFAGYSLRTSVNGNKRPASSAAQNPKGVKKPRPANGVDAYGRWAKAVYGLTDRTCQVTYTCDYGYNFDQVCDNQRYGLDVVLGGATTVFHYDPTREYGVGGRVKQQWRGQHHAKYRQSHGRPDGGTCANDDYDGSRCRCEVDEFPLDSLGESYQAAQALRLLDGNENGRQGRDWQDFINAEWFPCSFLLRSSPPVTWAIGSPADASDPRLTTNAFIPKYGFDSASGRDQCWATYTSPGGQTSVISDHGFRVQSGPDFPDPMFAQSVGYPRQAYRVDPDGLAANARPTSVASAQWLKKRGDEHEIPMYGDSAVQPTRLSRLDVDAMNNPNALKGTTTREAQPRGNSVVATASATAPPQPTDPALDRLKGKHELHQVLKRRHSHGHRRRYVD